MSLGARIIEINAKGRAEESIALRAVVLVAVVAAATASLREQGASGPLWAAVLLGMPAGFAYSHFARHRNEPWLKAALAIGVVVAFAQFLSSASGSIQLGTVAEVQVPLAELFLWVQLLHCIDVPARKDLMFSLASSLALVALAGVLSVSMALGLHLVVWAVAAVASLMLAYRSQLRDAPALAVTKAPERRGADDLVSIARPVIAVFAVVVLLGTAVFVTVPAAGAVRELSFPSRVERAVRVPLPGGLSNPSLGAADPANASRASGRSTGGRTSFGYFGFTNRLDTSVRGRPDGTLVMRVRASRPDFWRGQTFDVWDGRTWTIADEEPRVVRGNGLMFLPRSLEATRGGRELVQTYYIERGGPNLVFGAWEPRQLYFPDNAVFQLPDGTIRSSLQMEEGAVYTVVSRQPEATEETLRAAPAGVPRQRGADAGTFLQLPDSTTPRVRKLAEEITAGANNTYDMVRDIEGWLASNVRYSLDIPPLPRGKDAVDHFLFEERVGFCEQIGSSLVVLLRSLGIPARLVAGYATGDRNPFTGLYEVRASDAHAWAEVFFPGVGWQGFDPTASVPLAGESATSAAGAGLRAFLSSRLPKLRVPSGPDLATGVAAIGLLGFGLAVVRRRVEARRDRALPWAVHFQARLDREGRARGRPRRDGETVGEYLNRLTASVLPEPRLASIEPVVQAAAYSGSAPSSEEKELAERTLDDACRTWPARSRTSSPAVLLRRR